ncbi:MAG: tetratricopeptide repeat protein [Armatimonadetes bacterium]|nr:tetratricopeptide repeat protein [Armatimonadota bacterium]
MHSKEKHKLAAIVFTDLVGFTKIIGRDEQEGLELLQKQRDLFFPIVESYNGNVLKELGDGLLIMFESSIQAVRASLQIQEVAEENDINLRIGIHIGDVVIKDKDIIGSGVNIASRIQPLAPTGSICISEDVWHQIRNQEGLYAVSLGKQKLKNVKGLIEIFKLVPDEVALKAERIFFLQNLWQRRVPQILFFYFGACLIIVQIVGSLLVDRYLLSPHLIDFSIVTLLSLIPSILLLAYFHGKPGRDEWTQVEKFGIPINLVISLFILFFIFQGKDLGAITKTVTIENEDGERIERVIPKSEFCKSIGIFFFENSSADSTLDWLQYGFSDLLDYDLDQDVFITAGSRFLFNKYMIEVGFEKGVGVPFTLKKNIAKNRYQDYFITGFFNEVNSIYQLDVSLYKTSNSKLISEIKFENPDIFKLIDDISLQIKYDLKIPESHIEETEDLPVAETMTNSLEAFKQYVLGRNCITFENNWSRAQKYLEQSIVIDSSFAMSYYQLSSIYLMLNMNDKANESLQNLIHYSYKLPEARRFMAKYKYFNYFDYDHEKVFSTLKLWSDLYPDEPKPHYYLGQEYQWANKIDDAIFEYKIVSELISDNSMLDDIGKLYSKKGEFENALNYYIQYNAINPDNYFSYINIADLYLDYGFYNKANEYINKASIIEPNNYQTSLKLAAIKRNTGQLNEAVELYNDALLLVTSSRDKSFVYQNIISLYVYIARIHEAVDYMHLMFKEKEKYLPTYKILRQKIEWVYLYAKINKASLALEILDDIKHNHGELLDKATCFGYLDVYLELGDVENIKKSIIDIDAYSQTLGSEVDREHIYHAQGTIHEINHEFEQAILNYKKQLEYDLTSTDIHWHIGRCYRQLKKYKKAEEYLLKIIKRTPFDPDYNFELALLYSDMGKKEKALKHLNITLDVWKEADPEYIPAQKARELLAKINSE